MGDDDAATAGGEPSLSADINTTPLVDVMLVLLIIFIITVPVLTQSVLVQLPQASAEPVATQPDSIAISVLRDGTVQWNSEPVTAAQLRQRLTQVAAQPQQPALQLARAQGLRWPDRIWATLPQ